MRPAAVLALISAVLGCGCRIPDDPDGTLDRVQGGVMRVGVSEADPWVRLGADGEPQGGAEVELVGRFARDIGARVEWVDGSEEELVAAMKEGSLDLLVAGLTSKSRWKKDVAFTRPYLETRTVVGVPRGRSASDDLAGMLVRAELGSEEEALLERGTEAEVEPVMDLATAKGRAAAVHEYLLDHLDLSDAGIELKKDKQVMAVRPGENAFLVRLERFLLDREAEIERLVSHEGRP